MKIHLMVPLNSQYRPLWAALLLLLMFHMAASAADHEPSNAADDILKRLGHAPTATRENQNTNERSSTTDPENHIKNIKIHTVKAGDSLSVISKLYYNDSKKIDLIAGFNHITDVNQLKIGQKIKIPIIDPKPAEKAAGFHEQNLADSRDIETGPIEEKDLKRNKSIPKTSFLFIAMLFVLCLLILLFFYLFKLSGKQETTKMKEPTKKPSFVFGKADESDTSETETGPRIEL